MSASVAPRRFIDRVPGFGLACITVLAMAHSAVRAADTAPPTATHWQVDAAQSRLAFSAVQAGARFDGRFARFDPSIDFDAAQPAAGRFVVTVDVASADTRDQERDETLRSKDFFDVARWPQARFESAAFSAAGNGKFEAQGNLTIRDVTKPVKLAFTFVAAADGRTAKLTGGTTIQRLDFGVGQGEWKDTTWVGNPVDIRFELKLARSEVAAH
jgi:polyisoprenoid-binding protein YceI